MRLKVPWIDLRSQLGGGRGIIDEDTGESVGVLLLHYNGNACNLSRRSVILFDRYAGDFDTHEECVAFTKGVEAVLNHMIAPTEKKSESEAA